MNHAAVQPKGSFHKPCFYVAFHCKRLLKSAREIVISIQNID